MALEIEVRVAGPSDRAGIVALVADRIGAEDGHEAALTLDDLQFGPEGWMVAVADGQVVSTLGLFPAVTHVGSVSVQSAVIEFVATARDFEGRGLVRRQMDLAHTISAARGDLVQWMVGIPYFYRRFGYEYAVPTPPTIEINEPIVGTAEDLTFREAKRTDIESIVALQSHMAAAAWIFAEHDPILWSWLIDSPVYEVLVAERSGEPAAMLRVYHDDDDRYLLDIAAADPATFKAIVEHARSPNGTTTLVLRPGLEDMAADLGDQDSDGYAYYVRIAEPAKLLDAIRPELNRRLDEAGIRFPDGELTISMYRNSLRIPIESGALGEPIPGDTVQAPVSQGGSGVPPDLIAHLILGPLGAVELEERHADVLLGQQRDLMNALFPPQSVDVQSWVIP